MGKCIIARRGGGAEPANFTATVNAFAVGIDGSNPKTYTYDQSKKYLVTVLVWDSYNSWASLHCHNFSLVNNTLSAKGSLVKVLTSNPELYYVTVTASAGTLTVRFSINGGENYRNCGVIFEEIK